jgi:hypothetical protein
MDFRNTKVRVNNPEESKKVQEAMFKKGFGWSDGGKVVQCLGRKYLYFYEDFLIYWGSTEEYFLGDRYKEVSVKDILGKEQKEKPDDLVRYMTFGTGCNNKGNLLYSEKELKEELRKKVKDRNWTGRIVGYKLTPLYEAELTTKLKTFKVKKKKK